MFNFREINYLNDKRIICVPQSYDIVSNQCQQQTRVIEMYYNSFVYTLFILWLYVLCVTSMRLPSALSVHLLYSN